eukprot:TRINITY_DN48029_c0_g1_i1.p4 TRINITY_DN48029_c0_g1~~TRINITY_DN48029_c0_g1_i1.p4  ORF type:complete len:109 (-),score=26.99 TRINITY_DN48029_c0_g1_i1:130-456(-)
MGYQRRVHGVERRKKERWEGKENRKWRIGKKNGTKEEKLGKRGKRTRGRSNEDQHRQKKQIIDTHKGQEKALKKACKGALNEQKIYGCLLYTSPSPRDLSTSRMPSSA